MSTLLSGGSYGIAVLLVWAGLKEHYIAHRHGAALILFFAIMGVALAFFTAWLNRAGERERRWKR